MDGARVLENERTQAAEYASCGPMASASVRAGESHTAGMLEPNANTYSEPDFSLSEGNPAGIEQPPGDTSGDSTTYTAVAFPKRTRLMSSVVKSPGEAATLYEHVIPPPQHVQPALTLIGESDHTRDSTTSQSVLVGAEAHRGESTASTPMEFPRQGAQEGTAVKHPRKTPPKYDDVIRPQKPARANVITPQDALAGNKSDLGDNSGNSATYTTTTVYLNDPILSSTTREAILPPSIKPGQELVRKVSNDHKQKADPPTEATNVVYGVPCRRLANRESQKQGHVRRSNSATKYQSIRSVSLEVGKFVTSG